MALNDTGYFLVSRTIIYKAPTDTAAPPNTLVGLDTPGDPWEIIGHIGDETASGNASLTRDGGDVTTKGSITKRAIRQVVEPVTTGIDVDITQWTRGVLALYHGGDGGSTAGEFEVTSTTDGTTTETALLIVWEDGQTRVALYAPRVSWTGRDALNTDSIEDAVAIPLHAGFLDSATLVGSNGKPLRYKWISPSGLLDEGAES